MHSKLGLDHKPITSRGDRKDDRRGDRRGGPGVDHPSDRRGDRRGATEAQWVPGRQGT